jgi:hypothetical protein
MKVNITLPTMITLAAPHARRVGRGVPGTVAMDKLPGTAGAEFNK